MPAKKRKTKKRAKTKKTARKKAAARKAATRKTARVARKMAARKTAARKTARVVRKTVREGRPTEARVVPRQAARSGEQSGDLQGLSTREGADSESVSELLEEGNPFEAGVVEGVEEAGRADERPVHTQEVPEDDVPDEYLDKD